MIASYMALFLPTEVCKVSHSYQFYRLVATCQQVQQACQFHQVATSVLKSGLLQLVTSSETCYYGFGLSLDMRDSNAYVSHAKRTRCYAKTATFPRANFLVWSYGYLRSSTNRKHITRLFTLYNMTFAVKIKLQTPRSWAAYDQTKKFALGNVVVSA